MSLAVTFSRAQLGAQALLVSVEVHIANGLPALAIVGLPEAAVRESRERVRSALVNSGYDFPPKRITVNLAPADLPKQGGRYDLAIALGILAASGQIPAEPLAECEFIAELALSGETRAVSGILPSVLAARTAGRRLICAPGNGAEAALARGARVCVAAHLQEICAQPDRLDALPAAEPAPAKTNAHSADLSDVRGQSRAKRALEVAASGAHHMLLIGPPGTGKTLLASRLAGLLPPLSDDEALESAALASLAAHGFNPAAWKLRPFRSPHHTASAAALAGGGRNPRPGEISLAHHGVLFLDELPEFKRHVLEVLREPMESGKVNVSRATGQVEFPARFQLIAAMNPCPCGYFGDGSDRCRCSGDQVARYRQRVSGPLLDRIDLHIEVPRIAWRALQAPPGDDSATVRERVGRARRRQYARGCLNAQLSLRQTDAACRLRARDRRLLEQAVERFGLSARAVHRILKLARTIADLADSDEIATLHLQEAVGYRCPGPGF